MNDHYLSPVASKFRWVWTVLGLLSLLLAGRAGQAQIYNGSGATFFQGGNVATNGAFQNAGTYIPSAGTLLITNGDVLNSGTINPGTATVQLVATSARTLAFNGQPVPNLSLDVPAGTTLSNSGTISNSLTLVNGYLQTTAANTLTLAPGAVLIGETSAHYVKGHVTQTQTLTGSGPVNFGQTGFILNPGGQSFPLTMDRRTGLQSSVSQGQNLAGTNHSIDRIWAFSSPSTITAPVTVSLAWLSDNDNGLSLTSTNTQVWRSDNNGGQWVKQNTAGDGTGRSMSMSTNQLNSLYTVSTTSEPLPVELLSFAVTNVGGIGELAWQTASEKNSAFMEVQSSSDGQRWQVLGQVTGAGTSPDAHTYAFADLKLSRYGTAQVYYRLRLVDRDGGAGYSPLVSVRVDAAGALASFGVRAWPNPFATGLRVQVQSPEAGDVSLTVLDAVGRVVLTRVVAGLLAGTQELRLDEAGALPSGSYTLLARQGTLLATLHLVRQ